MRMHMPMQFVFNLGGMGGGMRQRPRSAGLSQQVLDSLPKKPVDVEADCHVCLDKCSDEVDNVYLPCKHAFCKECIKPWVAEHDSCPACRQKIVQAPSQQPAASSDVPMQSQGNSTH